MVLSSPPSSLDQEEDIRCFEIVFGIDDTPGFGMETDDSEAII